MSRGKLRSGAEICADCGSPDPSWASINRGLLICDECCSVHRSLGRHVSHAKSLKKGVWCSSQLAMVHALHNSGANSIWEHTLLDPGSAKSGRKKPSPKDPVHPTKADFIRAKHQNLAFVYRPSKEEGPLLEDDLNKQLHSSVRTSNLETSLRFLSVGANPNYFHPEKCNTPLHMAAKSGQFSQVELLVVYGADPAAPDKDGKTPMEYAREAGHEDLSNRLLECQYELTDRLAYYLCGRKPDHRSNQHYIIPEMADSIDHSELAIAAKKKLQELPNNLLEELAMDVYDEVDRRETDAIWLSTQNQTALVADRQTVPFLPVNPDFSSTRNQGRQKLARFNAREFATLIIDILTEIKKRQQGVIPPSVNRIKDKAKKNVPFSKTTDSTSRGTNTSDDEPLYDSVASDEDYVDSQKLVEKSSTSPSKPVSHVSMKEYLRLKKELSLSDMKCRQLLQENKDMHQELALLQNMVQKLMHENQYLRSIFQCGSTGHQSPSTFLPNGCKLLTPYSLSVSKEAPEVPDSHQFRCSSHSSQRPQSMYEPRERLTHPCHANTSACQNNCHGHTTLPRDDSGIGHTHSSHSSRDSGDYDNTSVNISQNSSCIQSRCNSLSPSLENAPDLPIISSAKNYNCPSQEEVFRKTEQITKKIQELLISAQEGKHQSFLPCSDRVYRAVLEMASIFPQDPKEENVNSALKQLTVSAFRLQAECQSLLREHQSSIDYRFVTQQVIQCAYDIAKAAKQLVTLFQ